MKKLKIAVRGAAELPIDKLEPFQGELKRIDREDFEALRKSLIEDGVTFVLHVWQNGGKNYLIDGHQRLATMKMMRDQDKYEVPPVPVAYVEAANIKEARRKVLLAISQHGKVTDRTLSDYLKENQIDPVELTSVFRLPGIDVAKFMAKFDVAAIAPTIDMSVLPAAPGEMRHSSEGVKQVQLFFSAEDHAAFMKMSQELASKRGIKNVSDLLMELLRAALKG